MVNINAMRAIVKHNVFKQLKQLSKSDQTKISLVIVYCQIIRTALIIRYTMKKFIKNTLIDQEKNLKE